MLHRRLTAVLIGLAGLTMAGAGVRAQIGQGEDGVSRELTVYRDAPLPEIADATSREAAIYRDAPLPEIADAISREATVYRDAPLPEIADAISREATIYREVPPPEITDALSREATIYRDAPLPEIADAVSREATVYTDLSPPQIADAISREATVYTDLTPPAIADAVSREATVYTDAPVPDIADAIGREVTILNDASIPDDGGDCAANEIRFTWQAFPGANAYRLDIATAPDAKSIVESITLKDVLEYTYTGKLTDGAHYFARKASSPDGGVTYTHVSPFSDGIVIDQTPPSAEVPTSSRTSLLGVRFFLTGGDNQYVTALRVQTSTSPDFAEVILDTTLDVTGSSASLDITGESGLTYFARCQAVDCAENVSMFSEAAAGVSIGHPSDLVVAGLETPIEGLTGQQFPISWSVQNVSPQGTATGAWMDRVVISPDSILGNENDVVLVDAEFTGPLAPGATYNRSMALTFPAQPGLCWLFVVTDAGDSVEELEGEANNTRRSISPVQVILTPLPDLVVSDLSTPSSGVVSGSLITVSYTVTNQGTGPTASSWKDRFFLLPTNDPDAWESAGCLDFYPILGEVGNLTYLPAGGSYSNKVTLRLPNDVTGPYYITSVADNRVACIGGCAFAGPCAIPEIDETNNLTYSDQFDITLEPQPDLIVTGATFNTIAATGYPFTVTWTVRNDGDGATETGAWIDEIYISENSLALITSGDIRLGAVLRTGGPLDQQTVDTARQLTAQIPEGVFGPRFVKIMTDATNIVSEYGFEANNVYASPESLTITLTGTPDLVPVSIEGPTMAVPGHQMQVGYVASNVSSAPVLFPHSWQDAIYLSVDDSLDQGDMLLGIIQRSAVTQGSGEYALLDYSQLTTVRVPTSIAEGEHRLILRLDQANEIFEYGSDTSGEANNTLASGTISIVGLATDLTLSTGYDPDLSVPDSARIGEVVPVAWRVLNSGKEVTPVGEWRDVVYLSSDLLVDNSDIVLATLDRVGILEPGQSYEANRALVIPYVPPGDYQILFMTDSENSVYEEHPGEQNNVVSTPLTVRALLPDLVVDSGVAPDSVTVGSLAYFSWTVRNQGLVKTRPVQGVDRVSLRKSGDPESQWVVLGSRAAPASLGPGESYVSEASLPVDGMDDGSYEVAIEVDWQGHHLESDDGNNTLVLGESLRLLSAPTSNLEVTAMSAASEALAGQILAVAYTVRNTGSAETSATGWVDRMYLSRDQILDTHSDLLIGESERSGVLDSGYEYSVDAQCDLSHNVSGPYFVLVQTDVHHAVANDVERGDNTRSTLHVTSVVIPPAVDLAIESVDVSPGTVLVGDTVHVSWVLRNWS